MGEVYRAQDLHLRRDVAIKVLSTAVSSDPDRLRRFQQEATAAAALNHPNILVVFELGTHESAPFLVAELLEGETLREHIKRGCIPARKAIEYAQQIASGLAAAHEKGIVHRDLKPENLFVTNNGQVKILDFGLAKLTEPGQGSLENAPTISFDETKPGVVMGTVGYMSPEQVRGNVADHRSDLFSFGAILYEMLSGKRTFQGQTPVEVMNAILKEDPPELTEPGRSISPALDRIVGHCLEKNPAERFQSARDVAFALGALSPTASSATAAVQTGSQRRWWPWARVAAEVALLGLVLALLLTRHSERTPNPVKAAILPPPGDGFWASITQPAAISPDGRFLALVSMRNGHKQLWLRRLDASDAQPIAGSEDASNPFWSPDSREIAFFVPGKLKKVAVSGGTVSDICPAGLFGMGGAWSTRGVIVFSSFASAIKRVPENGGTPEAVAGAALSSDTIGQQWPSFPPDGTHFLYLELRNLDRPSQDNAVWVGSLDGEKARRLPLTSTNAEYSAGYLLFSREGDLVAQKFDLSRLTLNGPVFPVARDIEYDTFFEDGMFTVSANGTLVYAGQGVGVNTQLTWLDRDGKTLSVLGDPQQLFRPSISPDGTRVAVGAKPTDAREKIWVYDIDRGTRIPLESSESGPSLYLPIWSPDGKRVAYSNLAKTSAFLVHASDGSGEVKQSGAIQADLVQPTDWSPDGRYLAVDITRYQGRENWEDSLRVVEVDSSRAVFEISDASTGKFSPDGHWLAYGEEKSGDLYVTPFPGPGAHIAVSSGGGGNARWRADGQELFYVSGDLAVVSARVQESAKEFRVISSQRLFRLQLPWNVGDYDVTRDGKRFLVNARTLKEQSAPLTVVTHWPEVVQGGAGNENHPH